MDELSRRLVPDELWALVEPVIPPAKARPQGGGMPRTAHRRFSERTQAGL
jgi:transposase